MVNKSRKIKVTIPFTKPIYVSKKADQILRIENGTCPFDKRYNGVHIFANRTIVIASFKYEAN